MKSVITFVLISLLTGCVSIQSNTKSDAVPTFTRVLMVAKMRKAPDSYVREFATLFPAGYEVCTLALSPLSFDNPDEAIRKQAESCHSDIILTIEPEYTNGYSYVYNAKAESVVSGQAFWKARIWSATPRGIVKRLRDDHIITGKIPQQYAQDPNWWSRWPEFLVVEVAGGIAGGFLGYVFGKRIGQIHAGLVGKANNDPKHIGQFVGQVFVLIRLFFRLFTVSPGNDAGHFAHLFGEHCQVGEFVEIPNAHGFNPVVNGCLCVFDGHWSS